MSMLAFDTHRAVKALCEAGAAEPLAEAVVATVGDAIGGNLASKADLNEVKTGLEVRIAEVKTDVAGARTEIAEVRAELKADIGNLQARLYWQLWLMAASIVGLTVTLIKLLD